MHLGIYLYIHVNIVCNSNEEGLEFESKQGGRIGGKGKMM